MLLAGFAHAAIASFDTFLKGAFSPVSVDTAEALKNTSLNITHWLWGGNTAVFESAWGAYIGFAIAVGLLTGFIGLILLLALNSTDLKNARNYRLLYAALGMSAVMTLIAGLFYFWFPLTVYAAVLICFIISCYGREKEEIMLLDKYCPEYDFKEKSTVKVRAPADAAYRAITEFTMAETLLFVRILSFLRSLPEKWWEGMSARSKKMTPTWLRNAGIFSRNWKTNRPMSMFSD